MPNRKSFFRILTERGPLTALSVAIALLVGIAGPDSAQFFNFGNFGAPPRPPQAVPQQRGGGWFGNEFFQPYRQEAPRRREVREDFSKAPAPEKRDASAPPPERNILVLGDAMADWLAYGPGGSYSRPPSMGV